MSNLCCECKHFQSAKNRPPCSRCRGLNGVINHSQFEASSAQIQSPRDVSYWANITKMQKRQTAKGLKTYGQRLEDNTTLTITEKIEMIQEELIDALMYLEHLKQTK